VSAVSLGASLCFQPWTKMMIDRSWYWAPARPDNKSWFALFRGTDPGAYNRAQLTGIPVAPDTQQRRIPMRIPRATIQERASVSPPIPAPAKPGDRTWGSAESGNG
jgi:hypothetical protein